MPEGRMLRKKISRDEIVSSLSKNSIILYTWCIPFLDVEGKIFADSHILKGIVVPFIPSFTLKVIKSCVDEIGKSGLVVVYGNSHKYMKFKGFSKNQKINKDREAPSEIPDPTPDLIRSNSGLTPAKVNISKDKVSKGAIPLFSFEEIYLKYPNKVGKKDAQRHFEVSVKTEQDWLDIQIALKNYLLSTRVKKGFIQNASTWFNDWRGWVAMPISEPQGLEKFLKKE